jgi:dTMP kinase
VIEGVDGSGKTVQARLLVEWLEARGVDVVATREPTDGPWGQRYRAWARRELEATPEEVLECFLEDRREHVASVIRPALERGAVVVCDRYAASTLAYQAAQGLDRGGIRARHTKLGIPDADLALWLRVPVPTAMERLAGKRGEAPRAVSRRRTRSGDPQERFERRAFLERVDAEYAALGLREIDGRGTTEQVAARVRAAVLPLLRARGVLDG